MKRAIWTVVLLAACSAPPPTVDPDAGVDVSDAGADAGTPDAGTVPGCAADNAAASLVARDGFVEACVDAGVHPRAQCGDGSPLKLSWRDSPDGGTALLLYFRGGGRCSGYVDCFGRDGKGGDGRTVADLSNATRSTPRVSSFGHLAYGFFDGTQAGNALAGFSVVHVPDCTGDLGARDEVVDFDRPLAANLTAPLKLRAYFRGAPDVAAAVEVAHARYPNATRVVLAGTGEGVYFALAAMPLVDVAWPAPVPLSVLFDGEVGVGDSAAEAKFRSAFSTWDGQQGRRAVRFVQLTFISDPVQRLAAPSGFNTSSSFQAALGVALRARQALAPGTFRFFAAQPGCHAAAMTPGLYAQYVPWAGGLRPQQPAARPNPDLYVDGGSLEPWLQQALVESGPYDAGFESLFGDFPVVSPDCNLPNALEP